METTHTYTWKFLMQYEKTRKILACFKKKVFIEYDVNRPFYYEKENVLGRGRFGVVYRIRFSLTGAVAALKVFSAFFYIL